MGKILRGKREDPSNKTLAPWVLSYVSECGKARVEEEHDDDVEYRRRRCRVRAVKCRSIKMCTA